MAGRYLVPAGEYTLVTGFAHQVVEQLVTRHLLAGEGVRLRCGDIEAVCGEDGARVFEDVSESDLADCPAIDRATGGCRVMLVQGEYRRLLYALYLMPVDIYGLPEQPPAPQHACLVHYQHDPKLPLPLLLPAQGLFALAVWIYLMAKDVGLLCEPLAPGSADPLLDALGVMPLRTISARPHPVLLEWNERAQDAVLRQACLNLGSPVD